MLIYEKPRQCIVCGHGLEPRFRGVEDRVYGVADKWNIDGCVNDACGTHFLAHDLTLDQLAGFYDTYSTHQPPVLNATGVKGLYRGGLKYILHRRLGYPARPSATSVAIGMAMDAVPYFRQMAMSRVFWLPYIAGGTVIEVGFGNGQAMALLRDAGWNVRGCEFDEACVRSARAMGIDAVRGEFTEHLFAEESVDAVVASHTIEHVPDPRRFFEEARRVLRPGGRLVLRTPNIASADAARAGPNWRGLEVPRHLSIHTPASLLALAAQTGFKTAQVRGTPLGGFIVQQSRELMSGRRPASTQSAKTMAFEAMETRQFLSDDQRCAEIVLHATR